jgi:hypothetical protein
MADHAPISASGSGHESELHEAAEAKEAKASLRKVTIQVTMMVVFTTGLIAFIIGHHVAEALSKASSESAPSSTSAPVEPAPAE